LSYTSKALQNTAGLYFFQSVYGMIVNLLVATPDGSHT